MIVFGLTLLFLLLVVTAMSVGVIFANKPIKGSCGGMSALGFNTDCEICGGDRNKCDKESKAQSQDVDALAYDATKASANERRT